MPRFKLEPEFDYEEERLLKIELEKKWYKIRKEKEDAKIIKKEREINNYKNKPLNTKGKYILKHRKCYNCQLELVCPHQFQSYLTYYEPYLPSKWKTFIRCDNCFDTYIEKQKQLNKNKFICCEECGLEYYNPYKKNSVNWNEFIKNKHKTSLCHQAYLNDTDVFCDILDYLNTNRFNSKNIYTKSKCDLIKFINDNEIDYNIKEYLPHRTILNDLIQLFKNNNKSFPKKITNEYNNLNKLSIKKLYLKIINEEIKIPYYKKFKKAELILQIINSLKN